MNLISYNELFAHPTAVIDDHVTIGDQTEFGISVI